MVLPLARLKIIVVVDHEDTILPRPIVCPFLLKPLDNGPPKTDPFQVVAQ